LRKGLYLKLRQAPGFYGVIAFSTLLGFAIDLIGINPIQALYYTANASWSFEALLFVPRRLD
jgi:hypothetical protein